MKKVLKPGQNTGLDGGIYEEQNTKGRKTGRYATIRDRETAPPTQKRGYGRKLAVRTPDNT